MAAFVAAALVLPRQFHVDPSDRRPSLPAESRQGRQDLLGQAACRRFAVLVQDVSDGLVTMEEFRARVKTIYEEDARHADGTKSPGIAAAARRELAALTTGTTAEVTAAGRAWLAACATAPWARDRQ